MITERQPGMTHTPRISPPRARREVSAARLPFPAFVDVELAQQALLLLAVEPLLAGVVLAAPAGTGKTALARSLRPLLSDLLDDEAYPFVEIPASVDIDNLLGGLDLEASLRRGQLVMQPGVLARAHGGIAYIDGINLLSDATANLLLSVMDEGEVRIERESVSLRVPARFGLIVSYDPNEGQPRRHLLDRLGLLVTLPGRRDAEQRARIARRNLIELAESWDRWAEDSAILRAMILSAREQLPQVTIRDEDMRRLSITALQYGVEGHRVDLFAVRAARASAALNLRDEVALEDLELAARLVIVPRATRIPTPPQDQAPNRPPDPPPTEPDESDPEDPDARPPESLSALPDQILEALLTELPDALEELPFQALRRGRSGSRGSTQGKRGRHVRSIPGDPKRARIDVIATLRAAAPWQKLRANGHSGHTGHSGQSNGRERADRRPLRLALSDVRVKQYRTKAGALFLFVVDASGSMALHRMRQAKGAVHALLQKAYVNRDRVALIAFRGKQAELLLPPTNSVELARAALDYLPTGGGTPLASGLLLAEAVARQARQRGILQSVAIVLTDGRANVSFREGQDPQEELQRLGNYLKESSLRIVVVDTKRNYLSRGEASQLAGWLGAEYAYLPNASGEQLGQLATSIQQRAD